MGFKKKAKVVESSGSSNVDWDAFNKHIVETINEATDDGENPNLPCFISGIIDTGTQKPQEEYTEYDLDPNNPTQDKLFKADFGCIRDTKSNKFLIPNKSTDSVVFYVDFPDIMINYGKFLDGEGEEEGEDRFAPYRELLAGDFRPEGAPRTIASITTLAPSESGYGAKSRINKLAKATGCVKGKVPADFDLGELLGVPFTMDIEASMKPNKDKTKKYLNVKIANISSKHKAIPVPEHDIEPFGVMMNLDKGEEYNEDELKQIRDSVIQRLKLAEEWNESDIRKALIKLGKVKEDELTPTSKGKEDPEEEEEEENFKEFKESEGNDPEEDEGDEEDPFGEEEDDEDDQ